MIVGKPPFSEEEYSELDGDTQEELDLYKNRKVGFPCTWLNARRLCSRYTERPKLCRDFERGSDECITSIDICR